MPYHRPTDLASALRLAALPDRKVIAGGTDVFPAAAQGQRFETMLDVTAVAEFSKIEISDSEIRIGAAVRWMDLIRADLPAAFDGLKQAARQIGSVQIQNSATLAGNLCNASPAADGVPPLLTLGASVEVASAAGGMRQIRIEDFIQGVRKTALQPDEIMTAIVMPVPPAGAGASFEKLGSRSYLVISIAMVSAVIATDAAGVITYARIAVGACSAVAQRLSGLEQACIGEKPGSVDVTADHLVELAPIDDVRGSAIYRHEAVAELCKRAIIGAAG
ncbi:FAD binding domain-containing protein [Sulfitobacter sp. F26204]|uniref:FAD binding domain-containing protein n=1 Tax=Sulfitobacter sp. F26204 TaxID=2996014 RepID=UPI00225DDC66|nr:FAD binding domain-containing protein [Sulfitobacter sp. F26204]